jgi:hypothetical protein
MQIQIIFDTRRIANDPKFAASFRQSNSRFSPESTACELRALWLRDCVHKKSLPARKTVMERRTEEKKNALFFEIRQRRAPRIPSSSVGLAVPQLSGSELRSRNREQADKRSINPVFSTFRTFQAQRGQERMN